jgi:hypothetical protein
MLRKPVIIAIGGKIGKPFLSGICTFWNGRGKSNHPLKHAHSAAAQEEGGCDVAPGMGER